MHDQHANMVVMRDFNAFLQKLLELNQLKHALEQWLEYRAGTRWALLIDNAKDMAKGLAGAKCYGSGAVELQSVVVQVLSQVNCVLACERNWSTFDFIHTKERNRWLPQLTEKLVY